MKVTGLFCYHYELKLRYLKVNPLNVTKDMHLKAKDGKWNKILRLPEHLQEILTQPPTLETVIRIFKTSLWISEFEGLIWSGYMYRANPRDQWVQSSEYTISIKELVCYSKWLRIRSTHFRILVFSFHNMEGDHTELFKLLEFELKVYL